MKEALHFYGPYNLISEGDDNLFVQEHVEEGGVYLWTYKGKDGYVIDYVGEASSIKGRFIEHIRDQLNGRYSIYDPNKLKEGIRETLWKGYHWRKNEQLRILDFIRAGEINIEHLKWMLDECLVFFAPIEATERIRKRIESGILNDIIKMEFYSHSLQNPPQNRTRLYKQETDMQIKVSSDENIIGLGGILSF